MIRHLTQPRIQPLWWLKKWGPLFFTQKSHFQLCFDPKHLENILKTLLNQSMATEKLKNCPKTQNPLGIKILPELKSVVLGVFKVKKKKPKYKPPYHIWNLLTQKSIVLVAWIFPNDHFLCLGWNLATSSLSSQQKRTEKRGK